jgi:hypothetical protein
MMIHTLTTSLTGIEKSLGRETFSNVRESAWQR